MSWLDTIDKDIIITTGDGRQYAPLWEPGTKAVSYNISEFEYPEIEGTHVSRGTRKGTKYPIKLYFVGDDHLTQSRSFELSASDNRTWKISHPLYGNIYVEPSELNFDNTDYNVSTITGVLLETIHAVGPKVSVNPVDKIKFDKATLDQIFAQAYVVKVVNPKIADMLTLLSTNKTVFDQAKKTISVTSDFQTMNNLYNKANSEILKIILPIENAVIIPIQTLQQVITYPALLTASVVNRINLLKSQFILLSNILSDVLTPHDKVTCENNLGVLVSSMAFASVTNFAYKSAIEVLGVTDIIADTYNQYVSIVDNLQTPNGGNEDSYVPDQGSMDALKGLINFTISNLLDIASDAKQTRSIICEDDTNLILLAHRFYGLQADDSTIQTLFDTNNIALNEILIIPKGRKIIYYV